MVVLPDEDIQGTDTENVQIKEIGGKGRSSKWLAVHIPDNITHFKPMKIISSKNAAADLEKIVGPNRETLAKELQTIIGVDSQTLKEMIRKAVRDKQWKLKNEKEENEEDEEMDENQNDEISDNEDDSNNNDDDAAAADDDDDYDEDEEEENEIDDDDVDSKNEGKNIENEDGSADDNDCKKPKVNSKNKKQHKTTNLKISGNFVPEPVALYELKVNTCREKKKEHRDKSDLCIPVGKEKNKAKYKNFRVGSGNLEETTEIKVPSGIGTALADYLNGNKAKIKQVRKRHRHKLCQLLKLGAKIFPGCHRHKQRHFHRLGGMLGKLLKTNTGQFDSKMYTALKQLMMDRVQSSQDGNVHVYPHHGPHRNTYEEALNELIEKDPISQLYNDVPAPSNNQIGSQVLKPLPASQSQLPGLTLDNTYDGAAIRVANSLNNQGTEKQLLPLLKGTGDNIRTDFSQLASNFHNTEDKVEDADDALHSQIIKQQLSKNVLGFSFVMVIL